ncbi:MAG: hypothetical protein K2H87_04050, partial [Duncaniella sp.]|nr:hypothetical protein [Duncaniella sp.]
NKTPPGPPLPEGSDRHARAGQAPPTMAKKPGWEAGSEEPGETGWPRALPSALNRPGRATKNSNFLL